MAKKILVVDDEQGILEVFELNLRGAGYEVATHDNGHRVLDKVLSVKPDLVILDIMLPGDDGYSIARVLAEHPETSAIPVLIVSALVKSRPLFDKFEQVKGFIEKPFRKEALLKQVESAVGV